MLYSHFITKLRICYSFHSFGDQRGTVEVIHLILGNVVLPKKKIWSFLSCLLSIYWHNSQEKVDIETNGKICWWSNIYKMRTYVLAILFSSSGIGRLRFSVNSSYNTYLQFYQSLIRQRKLYENCELNCRLSEEDIHIKMHLNIFVYKNKTCYINLE